MSGVAAVCRVRLYEIVMKIFVLIGIRIMVVTVWANPVSIIKDLHLRFLSFAPTCRANTVVKVTFMNESTFRVRNITREVRLFV